MGIGMTVIIIYLLSCLPCTNGFGMVPSLRPNSFALVLLLFDEVKHVVLQNTWSLIYCIVLGASATEVVMSITAKRKSQWRTWNFAL